MCTGLCPPTNQQHVADMSTLKVEARSRCMQNVCGKKHATATPCVLVRRLVFLHPFTPKKVVVGST